MVTLPTAMAGTLAAPERGVRGLHTVRRTAVAVVPALSETVDPSQILFPLKSSRPPRGVPCSTRGLTWVSTFFIKAAGQAPHARDASRLAGCFMQRDHHQPDGPVTDRAQDICVVGCRHGVWHLKGPRPRHHHHPLSSLSHGHFTLHNNIRLTL